jgi:multiple sugar transport system permease protein
MAAALALQRTAKLQKVYYLILTLPWAIPQVINLLVWRQHFDPYQGSVNLILDKVNQGLSAFLPQTWLQAIGLVPQNWFYKTSSIFKALIIVNIWIGFSFMMISAHGALKRIPHALYEASIMDGASHFQRFRHITLPLVLKQMRSTIMLGLAWTANVPVVIVLFTENSPNKSKIDTLSSAIFRWTFEEHHYGMGAALAVLTTILWLPFARILYQALFDRRDKELLK